METATRGVTEQPAFWQSGRFAATTTGLRVTGRPSLPAWEKALAAAATTRSGMQWAIGDLLRYADERHWAEEAVEAAMDATNLKRGTLVNCRMVAARFAPERRRPALPWSHHALVAALAPSDADRLLAQAEADGWGWDALREHTRGARAEQRRLAQAWPEGRFGVCYIALPDGVSEEAREALGNRLADAMTPVSVVYFRCDPDRVPQAVEQLRAWGLTYRAGHVVISDVVLDRTVWTARRHTLILVAGGSGAVHPNTDRLPDSVLTEVEVLPVLELAYPDAPKLAVYANEWMHREGWTAWDATIVRERGIVVRMPQPGRLGDGTVCEEAVAQ